MTLDAATRAERYRARKAGKTVRTAPRVELGNAVKALMEKQPSISRATFFNRRKRAVVLLDIKNWKEGLVQLTGEAMEYLTPDEQETALANKRLHDNIRMSRRAATVGGPPDGWNPY